MNWRFVMKCVELINKLKAYAPEESACHWDNVGLLVGRDDKEVEKILIAVDVTDDVVETAIEEQVDMIISHHPLIFSGIKKVNNQNFITNRILKMIQSDISYYAMHTNYDIEKLADLAASELEIQDHKPLEMTDSEKNLGLGKVGLLATPSSVEDLVSKVKNAFGLKEIKVFGNLDTMVERVAILPGSGKSGIETAIAEGAQVYITGDIGHHEGIDAVARNLVILDAGHYGLEYIFMKDIAQYIKMTYSELSVQTMPIDFPFQTI